MPEVRRRGTPSTMGRVESAILAGTTAGGGHIEHTMRGLWGNNNGGASTATVEGAHDTDTITLNGVGQGSFTWTPGLSGWIIAIARVEVAIDVPTTDAELWVSLSDDHTHGYPYSKQNPDDPSVAGMDVILTQGDSALGFAIKCPAGAGQLATALFVATVE